jgi:hypothetical protein
MSHNPFSPHYVSQLAPLTNRERTFRPPVMTQPPRNAKANLAPDQDPQAKLARLQKASI